MTTAERYPIPVARHRAEQTIERSRFICTIDRVKDPEDAQGFIAR
jgi:putative IMPACT (imprinted ancient) family translation regulator